MLRSSKISDHILVQLEHLKDYLPVSEKNKIIEIGEIVEKSVPLSNTNGGIVCLEVKSLIKIFNLYSKH